MSRMDSHAALARVEALYSGLAPGRTGELRDAYSADAYFRDPFNEVRGPEAIERIFVHMFQQLDSPRFVVIERAVDGVGVNWIRTVDTYDVATVKATLKEAAESGVAGPKVIVARNECMLNKQRRVKRERSDALKAGERVSRSRF